ncbi:MAG TPA: SDR family oxidoreductase [Candidatus Acidoferrales bacterium]|nr:SDR family oxidoreductase [Candidatus Acidoferrales bacterium]
MRSKASILITGCRGGIGLDVACRLLKRGHNVYATVHRETSVNDVRTALRSFGENFVVDKLDVTEASDIDKVDNWDIDVLINNAAIGDSGPLAEIDPQRVNAVFETNVFSTLRLTQKVLPKLIAKGAGRIVFMGSMAGLVPTPFYAPYGMTKFALESIAFSLRTELKPFGIKVIIINPGGYNTGFNEFMRKKYEWMDANSLYKDHMEYVRRQEESIRKLELQSTQSIAKQVVKAVESRRPKRRYVAPKWEWAFLPLLRMFG